MFRPHILLVEDNLMDVELALDALKLVKADAHVIVARSGDEALNYLRAANDEERGTHPEVLPEIVLLDLKLPGTSGFDVLEHIKSTPVLRRIPVIVMTSSNEDKDRSRAYELGANSYLVKPVAMKHFIETVEQLVSYWFTTNVSPPLN